MREEAIRGHQKKPFLISIIGISYLLLPLLTLLQVTGEMEFSIPLLRAFASSDFFLMDLFCSVTAGLAVLIVSRWTFVYFLCLSAYTIALKIHYLRSFIFSESILEVAVIAFWLLMTASLLTGNLRTPYLNPRVRWWKQPTRLSVETRGNVFVHSQNFPVITMNISTGGAFVELNEKERPHPEGFPTHLGEKVELSLENIPGLQPEILAEPLKVKAEIVWISKFKGPHPYGLGLKFIHVSSELRNEIQSMLKTARDKAHPEKTR